MTVLAELVAHHADEEEEQMFPTAEKLGADELTRLAGTDGSQHGRGACPTRMSGSVGGLRLVS